ncbi:helix-turn-helix domain-containing protein [Secundilactobacillus yichangensis]|uniref:helix-turn-helix domain-containing protein n=1 Tax=Secundilactobacillus yichangensis TaxID=2799580 RepID=UPI00194215A7|nr:helix-turn-helix domain-containing protein [Secundilactobacillus yichangensis]
MIDYPLKKEDYRTLAGAVATFSGITQIDTVFYSLDEQLLKDNTVFSGLSEVQQNINFDSFKVYAIFPVTIEHRLWGFIICNSVNVSQQRIYLSRSYLENIFNQLLEPEFNITVTVWDALDSEQLSQIRYFNTFLQTSKTEGNQITTQPVKTDRNKYHNTENNLQDDDGVNQSIDAAIQYIEKNIRHTISLSTVAHEVFLSPSYLSRIFKKHLDVNFIDYINYRKIAIASEKLALSKLPINYIANQTGFQQTSYFTKIFKQRTGLTPSEYRHQNTSIQKIFTIPRTISWRDSDTIFDVSKRYFQENDIPYFSQPVNGYPYFNSINNLADSTGSRGWIYTVDCKQPTVPSSAVSTKGKSVVQWIYTAFAN